jgi:hypothetical protein
VHWAPKRRARNWGASEEPRLRVGWHGHFSARKPAICSETNGKCVRVAKQQEVCTKGQPSHDGAAMTTRWTAAIVRRHAGRKSVRAVRSVRLVVTNAPYFRGSNRKDGPSRGTSCCCATRTRFPVMRTQMAPSLAEKCPCHPRASCSARLVAPGAHASGLRLNEYDLTQRDS